MTSGRTKLILRHEAPIPLLILRRGAQRAGVVNMDDNTLICMKVAEGISLFPIVWVMVTFLC